MGMFDWTKGNRSKADRFARTVVQMVAPSRLKPLSPDDLDEPSELKQPIKIRFAQTDTAYEGATLLVQKRYAWRGYPKAQVYGNPNRITILTHLAEEVVGTVTVGYDSEKQGLLADEVYKDKIDELRQQGRIVGELSKLAIDEDHGSKHVLAGMIHIAFLYGLMHECTDAVIEVVPRHKTFYEKKLGFRVFGEERMNNRVHKSVVLLHLPMAEMQQKIEQFGGQGSESSERSLYPFFFSPEEQQGILERLLAEEKE